MAVTIGGTPEATVPLTGDELVPVVQSGKTSHTPVRNVSVASYVSTFAQLQAALAVGGNIVISPDANITVSSVLSTSAANVRIIGGTITFTATGALQFGGTNPTLDGVKFVGSLSSKVQYKQLVQGVDIGSIATAFATPTYNDGTDPVDGLDFTHTLVGSVMTMSLGDKHNQSIIRNVVSAPIAINASKRYVLDILPNDYSGDGGRNSSVILYDSGFNEIGTYSPNDSTGNYTVIKDASYFAVQIGVQNWFTTMIDRSCTVDLSKIVVYEIVNDLATRDPDTDYFESYTQVFINNCTSPVIKNCEFTMMAWAAAKIAASSNAVICNNKVTYSIGGITSQTSTGICTFEYNDIDLRMEVQGGGLLGQRFVRNHCIASSQDNDIRICYNNLRGASWVVEILCYDDTRRYEVIGNVIDAEIQGISAVQAGYLAEQPNFIKNNTIKLSPSAGGGIEIAAGGDVSVRTIAEGNVIRFPDFSSWGSGFGIGGSAPSTGGIYVTVMNNEIYGAIGIAFTQGVGSATILGNVVNHGGIGIYSGLLTNRIEGNKIYTLANITTNFAQHASIYLQPVNYFMSNVVRFNEYDDTDTHAGYIGNSAIFEWSDNVIHGIYWSYGNTYSGDAHRFNTVVYDYATNGFFCRNKYYGSNLGSLNRVINNLHTANSYIVVQDNLFNDNPYDAIVSNGPITLSRNIFTHATLNPGSIGAAAAYVSSPISLAGYGTNQMLIIGDPVRVFAPYELQGCVATAYIKTAAVANTDVDDKVTSITPATAVIVVYNPSGSPVALGSGDWILAADNINGSILY